MFFTSKTDGSLVIDRSSGGDAGPFALYESPDGGDSWAIKEQSGKPLHVKGVPDADWRVRVDAAVRRRSWWKAGGANAGRRARLLR
jgi:hypothetical protein